MRPTVAEIVSATASATGVTVTDIRGPTRKHSIVWARHIAMALAVDVYGHSKASVSRVFNKDRATILYACRSIKGLDGGGRSYAESVMKRVKELLGE